MKDLLSELTDGLPGMLLTGGGDLTTEEGLTQAAADTAAGLLPQMQGVVQKAVDACVLPATARAPIVDSGGPAAAGVAAAGADAGGPPAGDAAPPADLVTLPTEEVASVDGASAQDGASTSGAVGTAAGAALMPALEQARHEAFLQILGRRRRRHA